MKDVKSGYSKIFNSFLDNGMLDIALIINSRKLGKTSKEELLDELAYRLQIEFCKKVILLTNKFTPTGDIDFVGKEKNANEILLKFPDRSKNVFIVDIDFPYFNNSDSWEKRALNTIMYYKYPIFGFSSGEDIIKFYENL